MLMATGTAIWYHKGKPLVPIRWVLLKDPEGNGEPAALLCTDLEMEPTNIIDSFIRRWTIEVTFQEVRTHMGVETQRQCSDKAIARTTPCLLAAFSITALWADKLQRSNRLPLEPTAWYQKKLPTFSDALAAVRSQIWNKNILGTSVIAQISSQWLPFLIGRLARAA